MSIRMAGSPAGGERFVAMLSTIADATDVPSDPDWHDHAVLVADLATLNSRLSRYITDVLDAEAGRGEPVSSTQEATLGRQLVELGQRLQARTHALSREPPHPGSG